MTDRVRQFIGWAIFITGLGLSLWSVSSTMAIYSSMTASASGGIGAVSIGVSEGLVESIPLVIVLLVIVRRTRPTRLRGVRRALRIGCAALAAGLVAAALMRRDLAFSIAVVSLFFPLLTLFVFTTVALRIGAPEPPMRSS